MAVWLAYMAVWLAYVAVWLAYVVVWLCSHRAIERATRFRAKRQNRGAVVTEAGSSLRRIDFCITQRKAQRPSRFCNESQKEEEKLRAAERRGNNWIDGLLPESQGHNLAVTV